jgi:hypothetical protein
MDVNRSTSFSISAQVHRNEVVTSHQTLSSEVSRSFSRHPAGQVLEEIRQALRYALDPT